MFHSVDRHGVLVYVSDYWLQVLGYRRDEVIGRKSTEFLTEASRRYAEEVVLPEYFRSGFCTNVPYQIVTKGGKILDIVLSATAERDDAGEVVRSLAVLADVTEKKREEKALLDAEAVFCKAFRSSATVLAISSLAEGRLIEVNDAFERTFGYSRQEAVGREMSLLQIWENPGDRARFVEFLREKGEVRDFEVRFRSKSGATVAGLLSGEVIDFNGETCLLSQINDITERKRAAEEIEVLHTDLAARAYELQIANEELEAFSYTVSHDLRKPLTAISGYCQVILDICMDELDPQCERFIHEILSGTVRMNQLIETLLEYSRVSHSKVQRKDVDFSLLATQVALELRTSEPQREVCFEIQQGLTDQGDPRLLRVVLENLLGNAWKYSAQRENARIEFGSSETEGKRTYFVRDNGVGFQASSAAGMFTPFKRLPGAEQFKGFGIGLATVARIIKSHGGRIWAEGEAGRGAVFYFTVS
ncbi:MAG: hypothetical protein A2075_16395 [Geobacteraceae bacterium GWC2_58_44]|nr:MAG: hypothetical protein A2075_16395 [Geobacteraceae bacterium GWC2_58_44]